MIKAIVCLAADGGMGLDNKLLFNLPKDLAYFKEQTLNQTVVMGRKTLESLPFKNGLPQRKNIVLSSTPKKSYIGMDVVWTSSVAATLRAKSVYDSTNKGDMWIIGGASIYKQFEEYIDEWHIVTVDVNVEADKYYTPYLEGFSEVVESRRDLSSKDTIANLSVWRRDEKKINTRCRF